MPVVLIEKQSPQITVVTLNRPQRRNSLTIELLNELVASIKVASDQADERVLILRGSGAAFCTGLDLKEAADQKKAHMTAELVAKALITLAETRLVTIAAVHGAAVAGRGRNIFSLRFFRRRRETKNRLSGSSRRLGSGLLPQFFLPPKR